MSADTYRRSVARFQKEIADLRKKLSDVTRRESQVQSRIASINRSLNVRNPSGVQGKLSELSRKTDELASLQKKRAELEKKIGDKAEDLARSQQRLEQATRTESRQMNAAARRSHATELSHQQAVTAELERQVHLRNAAAEADRAFAEQENARLWKSGGFFLLAFTLVFGAVFLLVTQARYWWQLALAFTAIEIMYLIVGGLILRSVGQLSEEGLLTLVSLALRHQLRAIGLLRTFFSRRRTQEVPAESADALDDEPIESGSTAEGGEG